MKDLKFTLVLRRYSSAYLHNKHENRVQVGGKIEDVKLFALIAVFIILIASINFMNLSTAKASARMKEVGVRKALGAKLSALVLQYMGELVLLSLLTLLGCAAPGVGDLAVLQ